MCGLVWFCFDLLGQNSAQKAFLWRFASELPQTSRWAATARLRSARPPACAARHNAARCVCWVRCGIPLRPELSGQGPQVHRLSPHARAAAGRRGGEERAAERSRRRAAAKPHDAVRVPLRCVPCSRARRRRVRRPLRGSPHLVRRQGRRGGCGLKTLLRGVRLGHGALERTNSLRAIRARLRRRHRGGGL